MLGDFERRPKPMRAKAGRLRTLRPPAQVPLRAGTRPKALAALTSLRRVSTASPANPHLAPMRDGGRTLLPRSNHAMRLQANFLVKNAAAQTASSLARMGASFRAEGEGSLAYILRPESQPGRVTPHSLAKSTKSCPRCCPNSLTAAKPLINMVGWLALTNRLYSVRE
jgi:hypothetical protein